MKKNLKIIIGLIVAFLIGISTTVGATTIFNSKDITYSNSATSKTNVKDSLDELYTKAVNVGKCPEGYVCLKSYEAIKIGDYISMTPTSTSYTISTSLTGYTSSQTINPNELNLWRVIRKNSDKTIEVVSEKVSSKKIYFSNKIGYMSLVGALNTIAAQYTNANYVDKIRHIGYSNQTLSCSSISSSSCPGDAGYETDINLVQTAIGTLIAYAANGGYPQNYWIASRYTGINGAGHTEYSGRYVASNGTSSNTLQKEKLYYVASSTNTSYDVSFAIRPILTLKSNIIILRGSGTSESPYELGIL